MSRHDQHGAWHMADKNSSPYRIQREADGVLHLYRDDELVDVDRESDDDRRCRVVASIDEYRFPLRDLAI